MWEYMQGKGENVGMIVQNRFLKGGRGEREGKE